MTACGIRQGVRDGGWSEWRANFLQINRGGETLHDLWLRSFQNRMLKEPFAYMVDIQNIFWKNWHSTSVLTFQGQEVYIY